VPLRGDLWCALGPAPPKRHRTESRLPGGTRGTRQPGHWRPGQKYAGAGNYLADGSKVGIGDGVGHTPRHRCPRPVRRGLAAPRPVGDGVGVGSVRTRAPRDRSVFFCHVVPPTSPTPSPPSPSKEERVREEVLRPVGRGLSEGRVQVTESVTG